MENKIIIDFDCVCPNDFSELDIGDFFLAGEEENYFHCLKISEAQAFDFRSDTIRDFNRNDWVGYAGHGH